MGTLLKFARWLAGKLTAIAVIVALGVVAVALWLYVRDNLDFDRQRAEHLRQLATNREQLRQARTQVEQRLAQVSHELQAEEQRIEQAKKVVAVLRDLESWWDRWFGDRAQQRANQEQIERMERVQADAKELISGLQRRMAQVTWERDGLDVALGRVENEIRRVEESRSETWYYLSRAWERSKWMVAAAVAVFLLGPTAWALLMYYGFAAVATRGRPIRLAEALPALPVVGGSRVSLGLTLRSGEVLRIREKFLQSSDEGVTKKTRFVLDWRIPFTSLACGLVELIELRAERPDTAYAVTLSNSDDPHMELAALDLPAGATMILRPSFLAGVIQQRNEPLRIRRHWELARWQSWITGQFRFFEFVGPCRLVVAGSRGVRAEVLAERAGGSAPARRTNQDATIGFTPNLDYKPVRAETFWSYYRGMNPLFDDLFAGHGVFVLQETSRPGSSAGAARFWSAVWNGVLKVFGL